jgi:AcrR family transcriptional regulator
MPKSFSEKEKECIRKKLMECAKECIALYGIKHTTVDEIVERAKVPKGTFYLFYSSKEALMIEVVFQLHDEIRQSFVTKLSAMEDVTPQLLADCMFDACKAVEKTNLAKIMVNGELEMLMQKLPPELVAKHLEEDNEAAKALIAMLPDAAGKDETKYSAAFRGAFLLTLHRQEIGDDFDDALKMILKGISMQMLD